MDVHLNITDDRDVYVLGRGPKEKSNKCNQCDYQSSEAGNLKRHLKMHSGEKSYKWNQCNYTSYRVGDLKKHLKMHSGERQNKCNQCDCASSQAGNSIKFNQSHVWKPTEVTNQTTNKSVWVYLFVRATCTMPKLTISCNGNVLLIEQSWLILWLIHFRD